MRINTKIKAQAKKIHAKCGMASAQTIAQLMLEIKKGKDSVKSKKDWISEEKIIAEFGGRQ